MGETVRFDPDLIREGKGQHPMRVPYVAVYERAGKRLIYNASGHRRHDHEVAAATATRYKPGAIVIEINPI